MGGSFDPVHVAHLALARVALDHLSLDEVRWVPVGQAWQKARQLAAGPHRLAMARLATAHEPRFVVDDLELQRPGPSYTLDTVRALLAAQPDAQCFLIIGQDQYANLPTWQGWEDLIACVTLAVARRGDALPDAPPALRARPHQVLGLPMPALHVSSTEIRARLARGDDPSTLVPDLLPDSVARYIANHQLYAPGAPR